MAGPGRSPIGVIPGGRRRPRAAAAAPPPPALLFFPLSAAALVLIAAVLFVTVRTATAQEGGPASPVPVADGAVERAWRDMETVDFPTAANRALMYNAAVAAARFGLTAAKREADIARGHYLPSILFEEGFVRTDIPAEVFATTINQERLRAEDFADVSNFNEPPPVGNFTTTLSLTQPIFAPKVAVGYRMAGREAEATALDLARTREEAVSRVLTAYLGVLTAKAYARVADRGVADAEEHLRIAERLEEAGMGLAADVLRARVFLAQAEGARVTAGNRLALARKALALAMGEEGGTSVDAAAPLPPFPARGGVEERIPAALANRADLRAVALRVENADAGVTLRRAEYLPTVGLSGAYRIDAEDGPFSPDNRTWRVGVGFSWTVFDGLRREAAVAKARAERAQAREGYRGTRDLAAFEVSGAWLAVEDAERRVAIARAATSSAEEALRLVRTRYENQLGRAIDVLDVQAALNGARADLVRAENDLLRAHADLELAAGTLLSWAESGTGGAE
jgi:outer membrane protein